MGNGFSRMLQKMSLENPRIVEDTLAFSESDEDKKHRNNSEEKNKRQTKTSLIKNNQIAIDDSKTIYVATEHSEMKGSKLYFQDKKNKEPKV